ncbi:polysaccharide biosynthesis protein [Sphingobacterium composti Ten et al. 2007 non Yoo et al. 2007]|uniref:polysaccharide biosynthesis protein n=1 Tax=Sphingobacterium composti TaxID=363260 RepID=UPI0013569B5D|nr:nucleoside-diphosphate sugar epimerase/dehydratase [Sphingobacterium composti Ten et al. 2007 non Yoo et al. 2007]
MKNLILGDKFHSKWLILLIDQFIVISTLVFGLAFINGYEYIEVLNTNNVQFLLLYSLISAGIFIFFRVNTGIMRYSNTGDMLRVFLAVLSINLVFVTVYSLFTRIFPQQLTGLEKVLVLNFFFSSSLLILLRVMIRSMYLSFNNIKNSVKENVLIYGSDDQAILIKKTLELDNTSRMHVIGFLADDMKRSDKYIEQKKVYAVDSLSIINKSEKVSKILVSENNFTSSYYKKIMDECSEVGIELIKVPSSEKWLDGTFDSNQLKNINIDDLLGREPISLDKKNILSELKGKRILITGAAGSIGSEIVRQTLNYDPKMVILCDQAETPLHDLRLEIEEQVHFSKIKIFISNIQNEDRIRTLFETYRPDIVFHAAAYKHVPMMEENPSEAIWTNVLGTKILADISVKFGVEKFVMISTDKAVRPTNVMGASKRLAEIYIQSLDGMCNYYPSKTKFITTRFGNVLGSSGSVIPRFKSQIERKVPITVTHPEITRYFMTIPEAVELVLEAGAMGNGGEIFLFDMGEPIKIVDLALNMIKLAGLKPYVDIDIVFTGLRPGEKIYEELLLMEERLISTHHPKIKISQNIYHNYLHINHEIEELIAINKSANDFDVVKKMKEVLPDYISNNSKYQELDILEVN